MSLLCYHVLVCVQVQEFEAINGTHSLLASKDGGSGATILTKFEPSSDSADGVPPDTGILLDGSNPVSDGNKKHGDVLEGVAEADVPVRMDDGEEVGGAVCKGVSIDAGITSGDFNEADKGDGGRKCDDAVMDQASPGGVRGKEDPVCDDSGDAERPGVVRAAVC